jgi:hypothetical protein
VGTRRARTRLGTAATAAAVAIVGCAASVDATGPARVEQRAAIAAEEPPTALVRVDNLAAIRAVDLRFAQERAGAAFDRIGVRVIWISAEEAVERRLMPPFTLVLMVAGTAVEQPPMFMDALGVAAPPVRRAHVYYDRIAALNLRAPGGILGILGDVMAHELGHLMLPLPGHSSSGIMRPNVNLHVAPGETFSKPQARQILARLRQETLAPPLLQADDR